MSAIGERVERFWFAPAPAARLAMLRLVIGGFALWYVGSQYEGFDRVAGNDPSFFAPVGVAVFLDGPIAPETFRLVLGATIAANILFVLGLAHRIVGPLFAGLLLFVICYRNSWSMVFHSENVLVVHVLVLGLTRAADAVSIDRLLRWWRGAPAAREAEADWSYGWPIRLICAVTVVAYVLAGVAKVAGPLGWSWATGEALRSQVAVDAVRKELLGGGASSLAFRLYDHVWLFGILGASSLLLELGAPLALAGRRAGLAWSVGAFGMHWGIYLIMGITFRYHLSGIIFVPFFEMEKLGSIPGAVRRWRARRAAARGR